jgi:hypothetical protein
MPTSTDRVVVCGAMLNAMKLTARSCREEWSTARGRRRRRGPKLRELGLRKSSSATGRADLGGAGSQPARRKRPGFPTGEEKGFRRRCVKGADIFIGFPGRHRDPDMIRSMNRDPIIFAMSNRFGNPPERRRRGARSSDGLGLSQPDQQRSCLPVSSRRAEVCARERHQRLR